MMLHLKKGPTCVILLLHHFIQTHVLEGEPLILYADNAPSQNKNKLIIAYLHRHPQTKFNFLGVGHTKFEPDRHFGTIKKKTKNCGCNSIANLLREFIPYKGPITHVQNFGWFD